MVGRRTKIVATLGPSTDPPAILDGLIAAGVDVCRINLSHGPVEVALSRLAAVRQAATRARRHLGVLVDLPGPKVRAASFPDGGVALEVGHRLRLVDVGPGRDRSDGDAIAIALEGAAALLAEGDVVAMGDGGVELEVVAAGPSGAEAVVRSPGTLRGRPGVALPDGRVPLSSPTRDDLAMLERLLPAGVDHVAVSFVQSADDIAAVQAVTGRDGPMVIAKVETPAAVAAMDAIVAVAGGVMVARGDLGVRVALEDVPHIQKRLIRLGVSYGRPVITATQMLESMITAPTPTRAEVTDVANAVFDGTSAVMLSAETAVGHDPVAVVRAMARITERAEREFDHVGWGSRLGRQQQAVMGAIPPDLAITSAITAAAWRASVDLDLAAIIACTRSGATARAISRFRPAVPLLAATPREDVARQLSLAWGVEPMVVAQLESTDDIVWYAVEAAVHRGVVRSGDVVAVLAGNPTESVPATDVLRLVRIS